MILTGPGDRVGRLLAVREGRATIRHPGGQGDRVGRLVVLGKDGSRIKDDFEGQEWRVFL